MDEDFPWPDDDGGVDEAAVEEVGEQDAGEEAAVTVSEDALQVDVEEEVLAEEVADEEACADPYLEAPDDGADDELTAEEEAAAAMLLELDEEAAPEEAAPAAPAIDVFRGSDVQVAAKLLEKKRQEELAKEEAKAASEGGGGKGKDKGKDKGKGKGKGKDKDAGKDKGKDKGKGSAADKGKGKGKKDQEKSEYMGLVFQEIPKTKTLIIKCWKVEEDHGQQAVIPAWNNPAKAKIGDRIGFDVDEMVQEGEGEPRPMASNVKIRGQVDDARKATLGKSNPPTDIRTQVLYYLSDDNLRKDKFFHNIITETDGGWVSTESIMGCRRMKQLGASSKLILDGVQGAPGFEIRRTIGQEAVRRTTPPPPLEGAQSDVVPIKPIKPQQPTKPPQPSGPPPSVSVQQPIKPSQGTKQAPQAAAIGDDDVVDYMAHLEPAKAAELLRKATQKRRAMAENGGDAGRQQKIMRRS